MTIRGTQTMIVGVLVALTLLVAGAGMTLVVLPQHSRTGHVASELSAAEEQLVAAHTPAPAPVDVGAAGLFSLREAMPDNADMPDILVELSGIAEASSVSLVSVTPSPGVVMSAGYQAIPMSIVLDGRYAGITEFLRDVRGLVQIPHGKLSVKGRLFLVNNVSISLSTGPQLQATLTMDAFDYGAASPTTATAGSGSTTTTTSTS